MFPYWLLITPSILHFAGGEIAQRLERECTDRKVRGSNPASRLPLSRLGQPGSIPALVLPSGGMAARHRKGATAERLNFTINSNEMQMIVPQSPSFEPDLHLHPDFPCLGLSNLAVSQPSCFLLVAWQLGSERGLQLSNYYYYYQGVEKLAWSPRFEQCSRLQPPIVPPSNRMVAVEGPSFEPDLHLHPDFPCLGLGNLAVSQPSCFLLVAWQLGTERVLQLSNYYYYYQGVEKLAWSPRFEQCSRLQPR
ncbi:hypothetical protein CSKR_113848 [Clonorchis sinensis]|uniref:Uncharacterized protein n=1 Tax=Clonorchis sinensis TaxID=79923 RepID=A0A3R7G197_CLOSI|nr:hypothetical protein CSKR_113848 [Clonorchis sinensis]